MATKLKKQSWRARGHGDWALMAQTRAGPTIQTTVRRNVGWNGEAEAAFVACARFSPHKRLLLGVSSCGRGKSPRAALSEALRALAKRTSARRSTFAGKGR